VLGVARGGDDDSGALGQRWATVVRPSGFGATVARPSGPSGVRAAKF